MGCQISCGRHEISFSAGAWFVMRRAEMYFSPEEKMAAWGRPCAQGDEYYGTIPRRALQEMYAALPQKFSDAVSTQDLADMGRRPIDERDFDQIRRFLEAAIAEDEDVSCSY